MADAGAALTAATRCVLAVAGGDAPLVTPTACWSDGAAVWLSLPADGRDVATLRRCGRASLWLPPSGDAARGTAVAGPARVYGLHEPLGLALHGPVVAAAMAARAAQSAGAVVARAQAVARAPLRALPHTRVALRVAADEVESVELPAPGAGVAPALPTVVAPAVRRAVAGRRDVVLATGAAGGVVVGPAAWSAGFALTVPPQRLLQAGTPAVVAVLGERSGSSAGDVGLLLAGTLRHGGVFAPGTATFWVGDDRRSVAVPAPTAALTLPD